MKARKTYEMMGILILMMLCIMLSGCKRTLKINLNDYVEVKSRGYETHGTVRFEYKEEELLQAINSGMKEADELTRWDADYYILELLRKGEWDKPNGLSNGDKIKYSWNVDLDTVNSKFKGLKVTCKDIEYTVSGLEAIRSVDPMDSVTVSFEGMAPNAVIYIQSKDYPNLQFAANKSEGLKNGDRVEIQLLSSDDECIVNYGMVPTNRTKTITVESLEGYACQLSDITDELYGKIEAQARDAIKAMYAQEEDKECVSLDILGYYLLSNKKGNGNYLYIVYKTDVHTEKERYSGHVRETVTAYSYLRFHDVEVRSDGTCFVDLLDYKMPEYGWFEDEEFTSENDIDYPGYSRLDLFENQCIDAKLDEYTVETNVSVQASTPKSTMLMETKSEDQGEYIFPDSDTKKLTDKDLAGLTKEELRLARNELYARHGRLFDDQKLQDYFNSKSWYKNLRKVSGKDFVDEKYFSSVELANRDLIKSYEKK